MLEARGGDDDMMILSFDAGDCLSKLKARVAVVVARAAAAAGTGRARCGWG